MDDTEFQPPPPLVIVGGFAALLVGVALAALAIAGDPLTFQQILAVDALVLLTPLAIRTLDALGDPVPKWVVFDAAALVAAVVFSAHLGALVPHTIVLAMLGVLLVYDVVAVHFSGFMEEVGTSSLDWAVPLTVVVPLSREFSFDAFREHVADNGLTQSTEPDRACSLIGLGDLVVPGVATVAVATTGTGAPVTPVTTAVGAGVGLIALQVAYDGDLSAGMIGIAPGTAAGYLLGAVATGVPITTALGL